MRTMHSSMVSVCGMGAGSRHLSANGVSLWQALLSSNNWSKVFVNGGKRYQISVIMPAQMSPVKLRQP
ncbi:hypothetical protein TNCV_3558021 [Trichonephila clavipes]|uniref:Uncharacterized protein n=1 Tax=Trichonephila clavipes TaxID=2585209 RepID=A0A8X6WDA4_TRICX|nr:hypothetical protein TNCV_3558021 [Trichonephila clavipes]